MIKKALLRDALTALSLTNLLFFPVWARLLGEPARFLRSATLDNRIYVLAFAEVLLMALVMLGAVQAARKWPRFLMPASRLAFLLGCAVALNGMMLVLIRAAQRWPRLLMPASIVVFVCGFAIALKVIRITIPQLKTVIDLFRRQSSTTVGMASVCFTVVGSVFDRSVQVARSITLVFAPFVLVTFFRLISLLNGNTVAPWETSDVPGSTARNQVKQRVVWVVFDELEDGMVFNGRSRSDSLKEFERLAEETIRFAEAVTSSTETISAVPSMLTGLEVLDADRLGPLELELKLADGQRMKLSSVPTLFSRASGKGIAVAVAGWALPYCRMFGSYLSQCYWEESHAAGNSESLDVPLRVLAWDWFLKVVTSVPRSERIVKLLTIDHAPYIRQKHAASYRRILEKAFEVMTDTRFGLVYVHLPIPHLPGIYDTTRDQLVTGTKSPNARPASPDDYYGGPEDYLSNLRLADKTLGLIRAELEAKGLWNDTVLVVSGDHGWRLTSDEHPQTAGPVLLVKLQGLRNQGVYSKPFFMGNMSDLEIALLEGELTQPEDVLDWAENRVQH